MRSRIQGGDLAPAAQRMVSRRVERLILGLGDTGNNVVDLTASIAAGTGDDRLTTGTGDDILFGG